MTKPKSPKAKPTRKCIFCGANANSKEHFWPEWLHPLIAEDGPHERRMSSYHPDSGHNITGPTNRQGGIHTIRIRAVCRDCNHGWMNTLEQEVRPALTALATAGRFVLGEKEQELVARWVAMKSIVAEHDKPDVAFTLPEERAALMREGKIPDTFRIYAALHLPPRRLGYFRHSHCIARSREGPVPPVTVETPKNIQTVSFVVGRCFFHINADRIGGFKLEDRINVIPVWGTCRLWPLQASVREWPRRPALDDSGMQWVASCLERYLNACNTTWMGTTLVV